MSDYITIPYWKERLNEILLEKQQNNESEIIDDEKAGSLQYIHEVAELLDSNGGTIKCDMQHHEEYDLILGDLIQRFCNDSEVLSAITTKIPNAGFVVPPILQYASQELQDEYGFVMKMIKYDPWNIASVSPRLRDDVDISWAAVSKKPHCIRFVSENLKRNKQFVLKAVELDGFVVSSADDTLKDDVDVVRMAVQNDTHYEHLSKFYKQPLALKYASPRLKNDFDTVLLAVQKVGLALQHVPPRLQNDFNVALAAVRQNGDAIKYTSPSLQQNLDIVVSSQLQKLGLGSNMPVPPSNVFLDNKTTPKSIFPHFFERVGGCWDDDDDDDAGNNNNLHPTIIYYMLMNRQHDLIPSSSPTNNNNRKKRKRIQCCLKD